MAKKLKLKRIKPKIEYTGVCSNCGCVVELDGYEEITTFHDVIIECPNCGEPTIEPIPQGNTAKRIERLDLLLKECIKECKNLNIPIDDERIVGIESIPFDGWSCVNEGYIDDGNSIYLISVSNDVEYNESLRQQLKEFILYEIVRTCDGCIECGGDFIKYLKLLDDKYGYDTLTVKSKYDVFHSQSPILYRGYCSSCGRAYNIRDGENIPLDLHHYHCLFCESNSVNLGPYNQNQ